MNETIDNTANITVVETPPMFYRAKLDVAGVYQGVEAVAALAAGDVEVPPDCDLAIGQYIWVGHTFMPVLALKALTGA